MVVESFDVRINMSEAKVSEISDDVREMLREKIKTLDDFQYCDFDNHIVSFRYSANFSAVFIAWMEKKKSALQEAVVDFYEKEGLPHCKSRLKEFMENKDMQKDNPKDFLKYTKTSNIIRRFLERSCQR
jgi:hypothetical protein